MPLHPDETIAQLQVDVEELNNTVELLNEKLEMFEPMLTTQEQLISNMMIAYSEIAAGLETAMQAIAEPLDDDAKKEFRKEVKRRHMEVLESLDNVADSAENAPINPDSPLAKYAKE